MDRIKVLHLTSTRYGIGGVEKLLLDMSDKYDSHRFEVVYCNLFCDSLGQGLFPTSLRERGHQIFDIPGNRWHQLPGVFLKLVRLIRREQIDILHLHMLQATIFGSLAAKLARTRVIETRHYVLGPSHTHGTSRGRGVIIGFANLLARSFDQVIAVSEYVKQDLVSGGVGEKNVRVIHNGIDIEAFDSNTDRSSDRFFPNDRFIVGTIGSLVTRKSHDTLINAFAIALQERPNLHLVIVGEGPERSNLERQIAELGIEKKVVLAGFQRDVVPFLRRFDLYAQIVKQETFGIVVLEAMAASKCVVAAAVGGIPEIVVDGETGFLTDRNQKNISATFVKAATDPELLDRMGKAGRKRVEENFEIRRVIERYESCWEELD